MLPPTRAAVMITCPSKGTERGDWVDAHPITTGSGLVWVGGATRYHAAACAT